MQKVSNRGQAVAGPLQLWDKLELIFEEKNRQGRYRTRIEDFSDNRILIDRPILLTGDALFQVGSNFTALFMKSDSAYAFNGRIIEKHKGGMDAYWISAPSQINRNQRRRFYRIETDSEAVIIPLEQLIKPDQLDGKPREFEGTCLNISGNGSLLRSRLKIERGAKLFLTLNVRDYKRELCVFGIIRRAEKDKDNWFHYGIEFFTVEEMRLLLDDRTLKLIPERFLKFNENQRTHLLNHIFAQQVALKKKGLV